MPAAKLSLELVNCEVLDPLRTNHLVEASSHLLQLAFTLLLCVVGTLQLYEDVLVVVGDSHVLTVILQRLFVSLSITRREVLLDDVLEIG